MNNARFSWAKESGESIPRRRPNRFLASARLADEIVFLHRGRLVELAPAARFFEAPESPEARAFLKGELFW